MGRRTNAGIDETRRRPATSPDEREQQIAALAYTLAEKQILDGTASSQVITHFLKYGSTREILERQKLEADNELARVKMAAMESASEAAEIASNAIKAMRIYQGGDDETSDHEN